MRDPRGRNAARRWLAVPVAALGVATVCVLVAVAVAEARPRAAAADPIPELSTTDQTAGMPASAIDLRALPLGTDKTSSTPRVGYLDRCGGTPPAGPPVTAPPWVDTAAGTWNEAAKVAVAGDVTWRASFHAIHRGGREVLTGNGLPAESGTFPVAASDPAYAYHPDPGSISAHRIALSLPYDPTLARTATCERGAVGITTAGIPLLDGFDAGGNDAAAVEVQDECHGHPNQLVGYHYHSVSPCQLTASARRHTTQVGWALDGFGIYVEYDAQGRLLTDADLDRCHGRTSVVPWHGKKVRIYHYDMTFEFPYSVGCFRGAPVSFAGMTIAGRISRGIQQDGGLRGGAGANAAGGGAAGAGGPPPGGAGGLPPGGAGGLPPGGGPPR